MNFHDFSHFIQIWLLPPGLILFIMSIGFFWGKWHKRIGQFFIVLSFCVLWLLSTPWVAQAFVDQLQNQYSPLVPSELTDRNNHQNKSVIIILGSGIEDAPEYTSKTTLSEHTASRLHYAAYLAKLNDLPLIVSGGNRNNHAFTEADLMRAELNQQHLAVIGSESTSKNTWQEAQLLAPVLLSHQIKTIYLVTHAAHMPRSMYAFKQALRGSNIKIVAAPMGYIVLSASASLSHYLPLLNALNAATFALHEYIGLIWYKAAGNSQRASSNIR